MDEKDIKQKTKNNQTGRGRGILRNGLCLLAGAVILIVGIWIPGMIFAVADSRELDRTHVQETDQSFLTEQSQLTTQEKLDIICRLNDGSAISTWGMGEESAADESMYPSLRSAVCKNILSMQQQHILPQYDFAAYDFSYNAQVGLDMVVNLENLNQYVIVAEFWYQPDGEDYLSVVADAETGDILEYSTYACHRTAEEWNTITDEGANNYMMESLGLSETEFWYYYNGHVGYDLEIGSDTDSWSIEVSMEIKDGGSGISGYDDDGTEAVPAD